MRDNRWRWLDMLWEEMTQGQWEGYGHECRRPKIRWIDRIENDWEIADVSKTKMMDRAL